MDIEHHNNLDFGKTDHTKILNNIINMQQAESILYKQLEVMSASEKNKADHDDAVEKIDELTRERTDMFSGLDTSFKNGVAYNSYKTSELSDKLHLAQVMEKDLDNKQNLQSSIASHKADKIRMVEINTYYASKYSAQAEIMKILIIVCVPLLIITILSKKGLIPANIADIITAIVIIIGSVIIVMKLYDLTIRNNMNFDEYEWGVNSESLPITSDATTKKSKKSDKFFDSLLNFGCVGEKCCSDGMYYDDSKEQCLTGTNPSKVVEGFCMNSAFRTYNLF